MDIKKFSSVEEMFQWKLSKKQCKNHGIEWNPNRYLSVEEENKSKTKKLNWGNNTDVLYSFLLFYKLGLEVTNQERFNAIMTQAKSKLKTNRLNSNSTEFLFLCSQDEAYKEFNNNPLNKKFLELYFSIGNVIPIWPGGNEARGKMGVYDIPELFFNTYPEWTKELIRQHDNIFINKVVNNNDFLVCRNRNNEINNYKLKGYKELFTSIKEFKIIMQNNNQVYYDYLQHRIDVIMARENALEKILMNGLE